MDTSIGIFKVCMNYICLDGVSGGGSGYGRSSAAGRRRASGRHAAVTETTDDEYDSFDNEEYEADDLLEESYCICQQPSFGEMVMCDNEDRCPYVWFHIGVCILCFIILVCWFNSSTSWNLVLLNLCT
jgi:hypothetical protein